MSSVTETATEAVGPAAAAPRLPSARGEVSEAVRAHLRGDGPVLPDAAVTGRLDPYGDDLHLALHLCYELHYRGFAGVADEREWDPALLELRSRLETGFLTALRDECGATDDVAEALGALLIEPVDGTGPSHFLVDHGELWQLREYAALRSVYHLKEADPHAWVIPRLRGRAKASMVAVEYDEFGCGRAERMHARLYAELMTDLGLDTTYGRYVEAAGAPTLATVNLMSLFGLHRALRGALVGHFASVEITSSPGSSRLALALERAGAGPAAVRFYEEHVEADAVHEQLVRREVVDGLLEEEPHLAADVAFGIQATGLLEDRLGDTLVGAWSRGETALRRPLDACE
ncbi:iron-containing redox enzyme family protein [Streptomyces sp. NPDC053755]|uniref:iron-containing redox enzyme family protein n=1 Tax=Streptomyces sp. NPDC053755 TaxID=3155815 RepID=UPI0034445791